MPQTNTCLDPPKSKHRWELDMVLVSGKT